MELNINAELKELIPKLQQEEYSLLEKSLIEEGCRDSLITWNNTIIDGHNRYEICKANNIAFTTKEMEFENVEQVKEWMINNQFSRRNLPLYQRAVLALKLKPIYEERAKENQGIRTDILATLPESKPIIPISTRKELSIQSGVGERTISKVERIEKEAPIETKRKLESGDISINQAYKEIKSIEKKQKFEEQIEELKGYSTRSYDYIL